jgi:hypothetical protein
MPESLVRSRDARSQPEADLLLSCARTRITPEIADRIQAAVRKGIDWIALIRLAMRHDVMSLLYLNLEQVCPNSVPQNILGPLRARHDGQAAQARRHAEELVRLVSLMEAAGISVLPYKGPALAQSLYGDLSLRAFGDLDIIVLARDVARAQDLILRSGYEFAPLFDHLEDADALAAELRKGHELRYYHRSDGTRLELHWRFTMPLACVKQDPERFLQRIERIGLAGAHVPSLSWEAYFLILSLHATKHKWRQLKLICDIAEILGRSDIDWSYVVREADDLGLKRMLAVGTLLAEDLLDMVVPPQVAQGLQFDHTARALAAEVRLGIFEEPDKDWLDQAHFPFQVKIRERLRDRAKMLYRNLPAKLSPDKRDREFLPMPDSLASMYFLVRPVRWAWGKMNVR